MNVLRWGIRLLAIHLLFILIIILASYFPGLDIILAILYILIIWISGRVMGEDFGKPIFGKILLVGVIAQLPGLILSAVTYDGIFGSHFFDVDYSFLLQLWHTPGMPLVSFLSFPVYGHISAYFMALFILSFVYIGLLISGGAVTYLKSIRKSSIHGIAAGNVRNVYSKKHNKKMKHKR